MPLLRSSSEKINRVYKYDAPMELNPQSKSATPTPNGIIG